MPVRASANVPRSASANPFAPTSNKKRCFMHHFLLLFWANLDLIPEHYAVMLVRLRVSEPLASAVRFQRTGTSAPQAQRIYAPAEGIFCLLLFCRFLFFSAGRGFELGSHLSLVVAYHNCGAFVTVWSCYARPHLLIVAPTRLNNRSFLEINRTFFSKKTKHSDLLSSSSKPHFFEGAVFCLSSNS